MTAIEFYPPVAAAAFMLALWFLVAYRLDRRETPGRESLAHIGWIILYPGSLLLFFWLHGLKSPLDSGFARFMAALVGIGFGALGVYTFKGAFFDRHPAKKDAWVWRVYFGLYCAFISANLFV